MAAVAPGNFAERFAALDRFLLDYQNVWRNQPFTQQALDWEANYPELSRWLRAQSLEHAEQYQLEPWQLANTVSASSAAVAPNQQAESTPIPAPFGAWANQARLLSNTQRLPKRKYKSLPEAMTRGIPGRKWQQIAAYAACLPESWQGSHWLDWCAGKGHLGRYLAYPHDCLCCIERDPALIAAGEQLSQRWQVRARHVQCDALGTESAIYLENTDTWLALHACGDLHTHLLRHAASLPVQRLAVAPCCFNRISAEEYQPLSAAGQACRLKLDRTALGLPLQATVTAGATEVRKRNRNMAWRLGFDLLQRQWRAVDEYLPVPSLANRWTFTEFADWCEAAAKLKDIPPQPVSDWQAAEQAGWSRLAQVRNLELVQGLFRRPLELWLVLDMALFLQEQGFVVQLGEFCTQQLTPRNLLLLAQRSDAA